MKNKLHRILDGVTKDLRRLIAFEADVIMHHGKRRHAMQIGQLATKMKISRSTIENRLRELYPDLRAKDALQHLLNEYYQRLKLSKNMKLGRKPKDS